MSAGPGKSGTIWRSTTLPRMSFGTGIPVDGPSGAADRRPAEGWSNATMRDLYCLPGQPRYDDEGGFFREFRVEGTHADPVRRLSTMCSTCGLYAGTTGRVMEVRYLREFVKEAWDSGVIVAGKCSCGCPPGQPGTMRVGSRKGKREKFIFYGILNELGELSGALSRNKSPMQLSIFHISNLSIINET